MAVWKLLCKCHIWRRSAAIHPQGPQIRPPGLRMPSPYPADRTLPENGLLWRPHHGSTEQSGNSGQIRKLFELLWSLGQCIELARMISGWYQIISCSLRRRTGQDRGGNLHEIMSSHTLTKVSHDLASQNDFAFYLRIAEIQITIFQTDILVSLFGRAVRCNGIYPALQSSSALLQYLRSEALHSCCFSHERHHLPEW